MPPRLQLGGDQVHSRWSYALFWVGTTLASALVFTAALLVSGCSFPSEGTGEPEKLPRWPWMAAAEDGGSSSEGTGETGQETDGGGSGSGSGDDGPTLPCGSDDDCDGLHCETTGLCVPWPEGSSSDSSEGGTWAETGSSSESTGGEVGHYGPCDAGCVAPWACNSNGTWEACTIGCEINDDCPNGGTCSGGSCFAACPCDEGAECFGTACWWPA